MDSADQASSVSPEGPGRFNGLTLTQRRLVGSRKRTRREYNLRRLARAAWGLVVILAVAAGFRASGSWLVLPLLILVLPVTDTIYEGFKRYEADWAAANPSRSNP